MKDTNFLILMRHAHSEPITLRTRDFDRRLDSIGVEQAQKTGSALAAVLRYHDIALERVLVSPAYRTVQTFTLVAEQLSACPQPFFDQRLYNSCLELTKEVIYENIITCNNLLYIGHNPVLEYLVYDLTGINAEFEPASLVIMQGKKKSLSLSFTARKLEFMKY